MSLSRTSWDRTQSATLTFDVDDESPGERLPMMGIKKLKVTQVSRWVSDEATERPGQTI